MSAPAEAWFKQLYSDKIIHKYKNRGFVLKNTVAPPAKVDGSKLYFPIASPGVASETKRGDRVKPMNSGRSLLEITTVKLEAPELIYTDDINRMGPSEIEAASMDAARALGQAHDAKIMAVVNAGAGGYGTTIGAANAAWDLAKGLNARTELKRKTQNTAEDIYCVMPIGAFAQMAVATQFARSDYTGQYPLASGVKAVTWGGVHWIEGYDEMFPVSTNDMTFYMWARNAIGSGDKSMNPEMGSKLGDGISSSINYDFNIRAYLADNTIDVGATVLLAEGIVECHYDKSTTVTLPAAP